MEKDFWQGVRDALPTALGYISIGLACGVVASPYFSPLVMALMSVLVYAGAAQFAMISLLPSVICFGRTMKSVTVQVPTAHR